MESLRDFTRRIFGLDTNTGENDMKAFIENGVNGFKLFNTAGEQVGSYARRRDAVRGAKRRGLVIG